MTMMMGPGRFVTCTECGVRVHEASHHRCNPHAVRGHKERLAAAQAASESADIAGELDTYLHSNEAKFFHFLNERKREAA